MNSVLSRNYHLLLLSFCKTQKLLDIGLGYKLKVEVSVCIIAYTTPTFELQLKATDFEHTR